MSIVCWVSLNEKITLLDPQLNKVFVLISSWINLSLEKILPFINHPTVQAGANFVSAHSDVAPKQRGLMLKRGQALYVAASGATALTSGFFCNVQGGFY